MIVSAYIETAASSGDEEHRRLEKRMKRLEAEAAAAAEEHAAELELLRSGLDARTRQEVADLERRLKAGLEKTRDLKKKPAQWVIFVFVFGGFLGFFGVFWVFGFLYICPEERVFRVFSVSRILLGASRL
jgi:hypothetical protein